MKSVYCYLCSLIILLLLCVAPSCPNKTPQYYFEQGNKEIAERDFPTAIRYFTKAIIDKPDYVDAYLQRAIAFTQEDSIHRAIEDYTKVLELRPRENNAEIYCLRAECYYLWSQDSLACKDWDKACEELGNLNACNKKRQLCNKAKK